MAFWEQNFTVDTLSDIGDYLGIQLLTNSDMRTKRISTLATHRKVYKTRSPYLYSMSGYSIFISATGEWNTSNNHAFVIV